jgi:hypothetical protein
MQVDSSMKIGASDKNGGSDMMIPYYRGVHAILEFNPNEIEDHLSEFIWRRMHNSDLWESFIRALRETHFAVQ